MSAEHEKLESCGKQDCNGCVICNCFVCKNCGLYEGALTTHCPEKPVSMINENLIYEGKLNYRGGVWIVNEQSEHSPMFWRNIHKDEEDQLTKKLAIV